jgi:uncharacterized protein YegJ (DUF2314 family)
MPNLRIISGIAGGSSGLLFLAAAAALPAHAVGVKALPQKQVATASAPASFVVLAPVQAASSPLPAPQASARAGFVVLSVGEKAKDSLAATPPPAVPSTRPQLAAQPAPTASAPVAVASAPVQGIASAPTPQAAPPQDDAAIRLDREPPAQADPQADARTDTKADAATEAEQPAIPESLRAAAEDPNVRLLRADGKLIAEARQRAKDSFETFYKTGVNPPPGTRGFQIKVSLRASGVTEHVWVAAVDRRIRKKLFITISESYSGRLANQPRLIEGKKIGDRVSFSASDIDDWMYLDADGRIVGNFTACAIAAGEGKATLDAYVRKYGADCGWLAASSAKASVQ